MRVCYLINQYPKVSHSFIRREILALESLGCSVLRIAMRGWAEKLVDANDERERSQTRYILKEGASGLLFGLLATLLRSPGRLFAALRLTLRLARRSDRGLMLHLIYLGEAATVARWVREGECHRIHAHFGTNSATVALLASVLADLPYSFTAHGPEEFDRPRALHLADKIRRARHVVGISSYGRSQLFRWAPSDQWPKIRVVHCGLDALFLEPPVLIAPGSRTLVCVGRLCEQKGQLLLVRALRRVIDAGAHCQLVLAGDGEMRGQIEDEARRLGVSDHIRITGWLDGAGVRREVLAARALVLPSFAEGLPVVIMESLALARPVISTYVAGIPELVRPGENGWLVPPGDDEELAAAMLECLAADTARLDAMGHAGRSRVLERHDVRREAAQLLAMFREDPPA